MDAMKQSSITIEPTITVTLPEGKVIVDASYLKKLEDSADMNRWWSPKDLERRYGHDKDWFVKNVFVPFEKDLYDKIVIYPHGGRSTYWIRPLEFGRFMDRKFKDIAKQARKNTRKAASA